jgi:hypothetical protein
MDQRLVAFALHRLGHAKRRQRIANHASDSNAPENTRFCDLSSAEPSVRHHGPGSQEAQEVQQVASSMRVEASEPEQILDAETRADKSGQERNRYS